ncbi:MAG: carbohydrate-binding protein [Gammaproteobacteria bacterium]|nr:carbohydrate-binding protein [Gammaproteobacteria bacterium]
MRKKIINGSDQRPETSIEDNWLNIEKIAEVEITSENERYPIESALIIDGSSGWLAGEEGMQTIRVVFNEPQNIQKVMLKFSESSIERTQEYVLNWYADNGEAHEIARQQWSFSPNGSTIEVENYHVNLANVSVLELCINPNISSSNSMASLEQLRVA